MTGKTDVALQTATDTRTIVIGENTLSCVDSIFKENFDDCLALVVADENTMDAAGRVVQERLASAGLSWREPFVFPGRPTLVADIQRVLEIESVLDETGVILVAVGAGTINDITKLVAHRKQQPFMCVATAASMDGYASSAAPMVIDGFKHSLPCTAPLAIVADLAVLGHAPQYLNAAGYGDMMGKYTAGADWILADMLAIELIDSTTWDMVQPELDEWLSEPARVATGDGQVIAGLFEGLNISALSMQHYRSSRPASGSEHQLCHLWEMQDVRWQGQHVPHGFAVGIGSMALAAMYELVLEYDFSRLDVEPVVSRWPSRSQLEQHVRQSFKVPGAVNRAVEESLDKHIEPDQLRQRLALLRRVWPQLRDRLKAQLKPAQEVRRNLQAAGCPVTVAEFGLSKQDLKAGYDLARMTRSRYTVLDLAAETGVFSDVVDRLFAPGGFWA